MSKLLVDTNVLIYGIDQDSSFYSAARTLLDSENDLFTTCKNISEFLAVVTRYPHKALSLEDALGTIDDFIKFLTILYPTAASFKIFHRLLKQYKPTGLKIHDVEIASIGLAHHITQVATFNDKDFEGIQDIEIIAL